MFPCSMIGWTLSALLAGAVVQPPPAVADDLESRLEWWRDARFGLFIHWGLYSIPAGEWKGETHHAEWILTTARIPVAEYEQFAGQFNPVEFDADEWARLAGAAGMRYVVITTKHHDGFCLFDSAHTDYDVMSTPFRRDIMKELVEACRRHGLGIGWYHSIMDWHHPDYLPRRGWESRPAAGADFERYVRHLHGQVEELLTRYGDIDVMWFDGEWEATWTHEHGLDLYRRCRELSPEVLINNRVDKGRGGMAGLTIDDKYVGDFGTPEQEIPATGLAGVDWETCMTMNRHWGWNAKDQDWKSVDDLLQKLVDIASKGGNFLLNVGPTPEGRFPPEAIERLQGMGAWMDRHGESIYGTRASPFATLPWGRCTMKQNGDRTTLYLHVFEWPQDGRLVVPGLGNEVVGAAVQDTGQPLELSRDDGSIVVVLPDITPGPGPAVVALEVEGAPIVFGPPDITAASEVLIDELEVTITTPSPDLTVHYTLDGSAPTTASPRYQGALLLTGSTVVSARSFHDGEPVSDTVVREFREVVPWPAVAVTTTSPGLVAEVFGGDWEVLPDFDRLQPESRAVLESVQLPDPRREHYGLRLRGLLEVEADGLYVLAIDSDDGSRVLVGDQLVVDNDGLHGPEMRSSVVALAAGKHALTVEWFNKTGGAELELLVAPIGTRLKPVPPAALSHAAR